MTSVEFRNNPMFLRNQFLTDGTFEMPKIKKDQINLENVELVGYDKLNDSTEEQIVHFFLDDYKFEVMWKDPFPRIDRLKNHKAVLSPNFSVYTEMPVAMKIYNTFRSRWCGAFLQANGIKVIPTLAWGGPETFWFCFDGIEKGSIVAVSTVGVRKEKDLFMQGYNEMLRRLKPSKIICYGNPFPEMKGEIIEVDYAETNNFEKGFIITKYFIEDEHGVKGMGSASGRNLPTWTPQKPGDERFIGKPGEIKEMISRKGEKYLTKIDNNGYAVKERHYSDHGNSKKHSDPHDHDINWSGNHPDLGPPINYKNDIPEFKKYEGEIMNNKDIIISDNCNFESIDDFKYAMLHGREVQFEWNGIEYGAFFEGEGDQSFYIGESYKDNEIYFRTVEDLLNCDIQGQLLKDIITQVTVLQRNV